jgi:hypothetical protein
VWMLHQVREVCGGSPQNRRVPWFPHKAKTEGSVGGDRIRAHWEASRRARHGGIAGLASDGSKTAANACLPDGNIHYLTILPLRAVYLIFKM